MSLREDGIPERTGFYLFSKLTFYPHLIQKQRPLSFNQVIIKTSFFILCAGVKVNSKIHC